MAESTTKPSTPRLSEAARHVVFPSGIVSTGWPRIKARLADMAITFDPWQEGVSQLALGKRADGKYAATVGGVVESIPRQVGKTFKWGALIVALCLEFPGLKVLWTAHRTRTATNTFRSMQAMVRRKKVWPHVAYNGIRTANGEQEIRFTNGSIIMFGAREQGFGRGFDEVDMEVFDEAQILTEKALEDMIAATNQARHEAGALLVFIGTPPRPVDPGEAFTLKRSRALSGKSDDMVYVEFSADPDSDPDDRAQWAKANPSFPHRTPLESMLRLRENLPSDDAWKREALGIWDEVAAHELAIPTWGLALAEEPPAENVPPAALALDRWYDGSTSIAGSWQTDSGCHVEVLVADVVGDTSGVVSWLVERAGRRIPVMVASDSPAASLVPDLKAKGVKVVAVASADYGKACVAFLDEIEGGRLKHAGQERLDAAVAGARKRDIGKAGVWGWDRQRPDLDISPLVAVTLAHFGARSSAAKAPSTVFAF